MWYLSELILLTILIYANGYDRKCPHSSQWIFNYKSYGCLDQKIYICLLDGLKTNDTKTVYKEYCGPADISKEGKKYILKPDLDEVPCAASQYQPYTFTTDGNSQCVFRKSLCKSSGQILANNGNSSTDASCRCDYRQNYDYVIPPKDPCSCKPAEEDCSCYIRKCDFDKVMIADYRCVKFVETFLPEDIKCPVFSSIIPPQETVPVEMKQFKQVSSSRTWSKQTSVILIVIVIIFTVLIGFLFFSVPHVTNILLKSKLELSVKSKENEYLILNGDNVKIECNFKSYIPVRSVTWQKEIDGEIFEITASEDKYKMDCGKSPSLTIDNFNTGDHGKYRCISRNAVGLRNEMFASCMNHMSIFGWLTGCVSVLQHIPVFHIEDITLHTYDIDSQSKPTVYNVFKGEDITMKPYFDDQHKLVTVKWFNENDKRTELDLSGEQYSGGVPNCPSLTIKDTRMENAGKYFCLIMYDNGEIQKALIKLKIIPQDKIYKAVLHHREDKTFIRPAVCDTIDKQMKTNNIAVITGREGTGKSKICLEFASIYDENEKDYMVFKVDLSENYTIYRDMVDTLLIIDDQQYTQDSLNAFMEHLLPVLFKRNIKVILTCRNVDLEIVRRVPEIDKLREEVFIDIDSCLTAEEKEDIFRSYMIVNNVTSSSSAESNFRNLKIITDLSVQVKLDENVIKVIRNEEPWKGFPLSALLFCSERRFLHLGEKYFTNPPIYLLEELKLLFKTARNESNHAINDYCVLVYIMKNSNHQLDLNDPNLSRKLVELYQTVFQLKYTPDKPGSNEDQKIAIEEAVHRMNNIYLKFLDGVYEFIHPCLLKAMFLSSESMVPYLLERGSLHDITEFVRIEGYTALKNELIIKIDEEYHHTLCERLVSHALENRDFLLHVAQYIYSFWRSSDNYLVNKMFKHIEFILFNSLGVNTGDPLSLDNESLSEKNINLKGSVQFFKITVLVNELTYKGRDPWIYGPGSTDFLILSALVSAAIERYATDRVQTFKILLEEFHNRIHLESFVKLWSKPIDIYGNTFFHYLMGLSQEEASAILSVNAEMKYTFDTENVKKYTPLDIAAFLGKIYTFKVLNLKTSNCTDKLRKRLKRLARSGKAAYYIYKENSKNMNIDQPMIHKTKDDSASPAKLEHEGADDEKKEEEDKNNQNIFSFKRKLRQRKEESNEKENHDKRDVLCFEDFMLNVVVNGEEDDYQSIIKLFSKNL